MNSSKQALCLAALCFLVIPSGLQAQNSPHLRTYSIAEIGTFGGNVSSLFGLNNAGKAAGWAETADIDPTGCFGDGSLIFRGFLWNRGKLTQIGTLGGNNSQSNAINASGSAVGFAETSEPDPNFPPCLTSHAFLFQRGVLSDLGTLDVGKNSQALGLNNAGQIVGFSETGAFDLNFGFPLIHAFRWRNHALEELPTLGGANAAAGAINDTGLVLGFSETSTDIDPLLGFPDYHAALWRNGRIIDMGTLGGSISGIGTSGLPFFANRSFNDAGQTAGYAQTSTSSSDPLPEFTSFTPVPAPAFSNEVHAFRWQNGAMHDVGTLGGGFSEATALNDRGHAAGISTADHIPDPDNIDWFGVPFPKIHAALWRNGTVVDLGTLGGPDAQAFAINNCDQIVGWSLLSDNLTLDAFLWQDGTMVDLNSLIPQNSGWQLLQATEINDRGQIGGVGFLNGQLRAFLLNPSTEDASATPAVQSATHRAVRVRPGTDGARNTRPGSHRTLR